MKQFHVTINGNGRVVIPAPIRKELGIKEGDELMITLKGENIQMQTVKQSLNKLQNIIKKKNVSLSDELIKIRRGEVV